MSLCEEHILVESRADARRSMSIVVESKADARRSMSLCEGLIVVEYNPLIWRDWGEGL